MPARRVKSGTALARRLLPGRQAAIKNWQPRNAHLCRHHLRHLWEKLDPLSMMAWNKCVLECLEPRRRQPPPLICRNPQFEGFEVWQTAAPSSRHASAPPAFFRIRSPETKHQPGLFFGLGCERAITHSSGFVRDDER